VPRYSFLCYKVSQSSLWYTRAWTCRYCYQGTVLSVTKVHCSILCQCTIFSVTKGLFSLLPRYNIFCLQRYSIPCQGTIFPVTKFSILSIKVQASPLLVKGHKLVEIVTKVQYSLFPRYSITKFPLIPGLKISAWVPRYSILFYCTYVLNYCCMVSQNNFQ
jgi:hypothetical protein